MLEKKIVRNKKLNNQKSKFKKQHQYFEPNSLYVNSKQKNSPLKVQKDYFFLQTISITLKEIQSK